jgi:hypothetical protein
VPTTNSTTSTVIARRVRCGLCLTDCVSEDALDADAKAKKKAAAREKRHAKKVRALGATRVLTVILCAG